MNLWLKWYLKQPGFTYSSCGQFTKNKKKKFMQTGNADYIYKNDRDKVFCQHDRAYDEFKDFAKRTQSDNILRDKTFAIASNTKYDGYQKGLASMAYRFFDKNLLEVVLKMKLYKINNLQMHLTNQLLENLKKEKFVIHH